MAIKGIFYAVCRCAVCCVALCRIWIRLLSGSSRGVRVCAAADAHRVSLCICVTVPLLC